MGMMMVPSGAVIGSPTMELTSTICLIFSKVVFIMPSIGWSLILIHRLFQFGLLLLSTYRKRLIRAKFCFRMCSEPLVRLLFAAAPGAQAPRAHR